MNRFADEQRRRNLLRDGEWQLAADHRRAVTERILRLAQPSMRLGVLGAGNCNDLDLTALAAAFSEIHLVDFDQEALLRGVNRQLKTDDRRVWLHGGCDLTGIWAELARLANAPDRAEAISQELIATALAPGPFDLGGPYDVVVSAGVLSQLIEAVTSSVPPRTPGFWPLLLAVRTGHLRLCGRLTAPEGTSLIVSDFVSSATCLTLDQTPADKLPALVEQLAAAQNFFHGLNPLFITRLFQDDPVLRELFSNITHRGYWLWRQRARKYAVFSIEAQRR